MYGFNSSIVVIIVIVAVSILFVEMIKYHIPRNKLNDNDIKRIKRYGLCHVTDEENVANILEKGLDSNKGKEMSKAEKGLVWLYIADPEQIRIKADIVRSKGKNRSKRNKIVIFKNLSDEQISKIRIRRAPKWVCFVLRPLKIQYDDEAIVYKGDFNTSEKSLVDYSDLIS